jgi:hypothetical protein
MKRRLIRDLCLPICGRFLCIALGLALTSGGCVKRQIESNRRASARAYSSHLASYSETGETPEQAAQAAQLREKVLEAEWIERGYRVGNEKRGPVVYSAAGMGPVRGLGYLFLELPRQMIAFSGGDRPARAVRLMEDAKAPDARRQGINDLARWDFAQGGPYVRRYRQIASGDPDPLVRSVAIRALNRARDPDARPIFVAALSDPNELVRLEGAKALLNLPDPAAMDALIRLVGNPEEDRDVRIAAAEALKHYKKIEVARALVPRLNERDFSVSWQARRSLRRMTGKDFFYNEAAWLEYIAGPDKPFG